MVTNISRYRSDNPFSYFIPGGRGDGVGYRDIVVPGQPVILYYAISQGLAGSVGHPVMDDITRVDGVVAIYPYINLVRQNKEPPDFLFIVSRAIILMLFRKIRVNTTA